MRIDLLKTLPEWIEAGLITPEAAEKIKQYQSSKEPQGPNRIVIVFGILGALLVGLGIVLIVANNWEALPRSIKTVLAFAPLIVGQVACAYSLWQVPHSAAWREGSSTFTFFGVSVSISLVAQIYHISEGDLGPFLLSWALLSFPIMYVMRASFASLLYWTVITYFLYETGFNHSYNNDSGPYWWLVLLGLPYYAWLVYRHPDSNFTGFHHWGIPGSLLLAYATIEPDSGALYMWGYFLLLGVFYLFGQMPFIHRRAVWHNGYTIIGGAGMLFMLLFLSFGDIWKGAKNELFFEPGWIQTPSGLSILLFLAAMGVLLWIIYRSKQTLQPLMVTPLIFSAAFLIGQRYELLPIVIINILLLAISVGAIWKGARQMRLSLVNGGLLLLTTQIACRFFETDIPFAVRGLIFIMVGFGFFFANYRLLRHKQSAQ